MTLGELQQRNTELEAQLAGKIAQYEKDQQQRLLFVSAIDAIAEKIKNLDSHEEILDNANRILGETLQLDRALIYYVCFDENYLQGLCEWLNGEHPDIVTTKAKYPLDLFIKPFTQLKVTQKFLTSHVGSVNAHYIGDGSGEMLHGQFKIKSLIWYPFDFDGNNFYVFTLNQILYERQWTEEELNFVGSVAKQVSLALMKIRLTKERQALIKSETKLRTSNNRYRKAQEIGGVANWEYNLQTGAFWGSEQAKIIYGIDPNSETFSTEEIESCIPERERVHQALIDLIEHGKPYDLEFDIITHDKGIRKTIISKAELEKDKNGNLVKVSGVIQEITAQKKTEIKIKESEAKFKKISELSTDYSYSHAIGDDGTISLEWSFGAFEQITGYKAEDSVKPEVMTKLIHPDDFAEVGKRVEQVLAGKAVVTELRIISKSGEVKWIRDKGVPEWDDARKRIIRCVGTAKEITNEKIAQIQLEKAKEKAEESDKLKTEFLNNMSHEIRTPMNGIIGFSDFLGNPDLSPEKQLYYTRIIQNSAKRLLQVIDDILEISTLSTKQVKLDKALFCLNDFLMELFSIFNLKACERKIPIYLKKALPDNYSYLKTDKSKLSKVLTNLIDNAIKYTNSGFIEIGYTWDKQNLQLYVKDSGIGIAQKNQEVIFERFSQVERESSKTMSGLGLGLSIAKENAELIGGSISLESKKGEGSTFYLNITVFPANKEGEAYNTLDTLNNLEKITKPKVR